MTAATATTQDSLIVTAPRFEHYDVPLGIGLTRPRVSWTVRTEMPGWRQSGYEIESVTSDENCAGRVRAGSVVRQRAGAVGRSGPDLT